MKLFTLRSFKQRLRHKRRSFIRLLNLLEKKPPRNLHSISIKASTAVWHEVDCLSCANCCKVMTPTYTNRDMKRIAGHLQMTVDAFKSKWLKKERGTGEWINRSTPCQFLDAKTNLCNIYEVRPVDCSGFPHLTKRRMVDYIHIHKQNLDECPATYKMVEKIEGLMKEDRSRK